MRWAAHIAVGAGLAAAVNPLTIPAAVIGATAPDWLEWVCRAVGQPVRHRTVTHVLLYWLLGCIALLLLDLGPFDAHALGFFVGGLSHVLADSCTVSGVPALPWSTRRFHLLGGKLRTGGSGELVLAAGVLAAGIAISFYTGSVSKIGGYIPFFPDYHDKYTRGIVDAREWRDHRFTIF